MPYRKIARYLDEPPYFLFWRFPEAIPLISTICLGITIGHFLYFVGVGVVTTYLLRKYNAKQKPGYLLHFCYRLGLLYTKAKTLPNRYITSFYA